MACFACKKKFGKRFDKNWQSFCFAAGRIHFEKEKIHDFSRKKKNKHEQRFFSDTHSLQVQIKQKKYTVRLEILYRASYSLQYIKAKISLIAINANKCKFLSPLSWEFFDSLLTVLPSSFLPNLIRRWFLSFFPFHQNRPHFFLSIQDVWKSEAILKIYIRNSWLSGCRLYAVSLVFMKNEFINV